MVISGKDIAAQMQSSMLQQVDAMAAKYGRTPHLVIIQVGDDPASTVYVRNKMRAAERCHIRTQHILLPAGISEQELCRLTDKHNTDQDVDAILVQLPLPAHISEQKVIRTILPEKDADGFHPDNISLLLRQPAQPDHAATINAPVPDYGCPIACTAKGVMALLASTGVNLSGKHAVMVGETDVISEPMAKLLKDKQCTVTIVRSDAYDLQAACRVADILIVGADKPGLITRDCIRPGAIVFDAGLNRLPDGSLTGDVDFEACKDVASFITPVPGGVGVMIVAMLMHNTIECYNRRING